MLQEGVVSGSTIPLQGRGAQVRGQVRAREQGDPLLESWESKPLSILLACCTLKGTTQYSSGCGD